MSPIFLRVEIRPADGYNLKQGGKNNMKKSFRVVTLIAAAATAEAASTRRAYATAGAPHGMVEQ